MSAISILDDVNSQNIVPKYVSNISEPSDKILSTILSLLVSAFIFITILSLYEIVRVYINGYYRKKAESSNRNPVDAAYYSALNSSITFSMFCLLFLIIALPILAWITITYFK